MSNYSHLNIYLLTIKCTQRYFHLLLGSMKSVCCKCEDPNKTSLEKAKIETHCFTRRNTGTLRSGYFFCWTRISLTSGFHELHRLRFTWNVRLHVIIYSWLMK